MRALIAIVLVGLAVIFIVSFFRPRASRRFQEKVKGYTDRLSDKARHRAGRGGDVTAEMFEKVSRATQSVEHAGRKAHDKVFRSSEGAAQERTLEERYGENAERGDEG
ncbi:MAG: hypothetical protein ACRDMV_19395 [Streptosporangiales bacterium]